MGEQRFGGIRVRVAHEAARLMYEEGVKQYFTAKRIAAKRLLGRAGGRQLRYRPSDLPSNGEIRDALLQLAELAEGERRLHRLFAMRIVALEAMRALEAFTPRLIGSVSTGHVRRGSDVDIHVFTDAEELLERHLRELRWVFERESVDILKGGAVRSYVHYHVADVLPVELTLYPRRELAIRPRSSTDGKPIVRVSVGKLEEMLAREHPTAWATYLEEGTVEGMDALHEDDEETRCGPGPDGPYAGLLRDGAGVG